MREDNGYRPPLQRLLERLPPAARPLGFAFVIVVLIGLAVVRFTNPDPGPILSAVIGVILISVGGVGTARAARRPPTADEIEGMRVVALGWLVSFLPRPIIRGFLFVMGLVMIGLGVVALVAVALGEA